MKRFFIMSLSALLLMAASAYAEQADSLNLKQEKLFIGARVGMPMAEADFSSFGADKFRPSWNLGVNLGYRFTDVWSLEMTAAWGQLLLGEKECCFDYQYFLGSDMNRYHPNLIPDGMDGRYYRDLQSTTFLQRYGLQANMNILGLFAGTKTGPWRLEIAPAIYAVGTSSDIVTKQDKTPFAENISKWHFGYGGQVQASYAVGQNMNIGLYGGYTQVTGRQMDGMPGLHTSNFIIDAGLKLTFSLIKTKRPARQTATAVPAAQPVQQVQPAQPVQPEETVPAQNLTETAPVEATPSEETPSEVAPAETVPAETVPSEEVKQEEPAETAPATEMQETTFPIVYFSFNSIWIEPSERGKVKEIAERMKADKSIRVRVIGWCDPVGSEEANKRVSLQRAEAVKRVLGQWLVPADRIETVGGGVKKDAASDAEARNATTFEIL